MPAQKERSVKISRDDESDILILSITEIKGKRNPRKEVTHYRMEKNPNAKRAWRLFKLVHADEEAKVYDVLIDGEYSSCDRIGHEQHRHCRHVESITALYEAGKLQ